MIVEEITKKYTIDISCIRKGNNYLLKLSVSQNAVGIMYKMSAVLFRYKWHILEVVAETVSAGLVKDVFIIHNKDDREMDDAELNRIKADIRALISNQKSPEDYMKENEIRNLIARDDSAQANITIFNPSTIDCTVLDIKTDVVSWHLLKISEFLYYNKLDIISLVVKAEENFCRYSFLLKEINGEKLSPDRMKFFENSFPEIL